MKKFIEPEMDLMKLDVADVITTSCVADCRYETEVDE